MKKNLIYIFSFLFIVLSCRPDKRNEKIKFSQEEWLHGDRTTRGSMVDNIIEDSILIGKSKVQILKLLGDQGDTIGNFSYPVDIGFRVGPLGIGGVWLYSLNIYFDSLENKVYEVRCTD